MHTANCVRHFFYSVVFAEESAGTLLHKFSDVDIGEVLGEDDHLELRIFAPDLGESLASIHHMHIQVEQNNIGRMRLKPVNELFAIRGEESKLQVLVFTQELYNSLPFNSVIFGKSDLYRFFHMRSSM